MGGAGGGSIIAALVPPAPRPDAAMKRWSILTLVTVAFALGALSALAVAPLVPFLLESLRLSRTQIGLLLPALYLGGVVMSPLAGWLTDRLGVRWTLGAGLGLTGLMIAAASLSPGLPALLLCLVGAGAGFSVQNPATGRAVIEWFEPRERGAAMGIKQTGLTLGGVLGALTLPTTALALGWRTAMLAAGLAAVAGAVAFLVGYRSPETRTAGATMSGAHFSELGVYVRRPAVLVLLLSGLALSTCQSSVLGYLVLWARDALAFTPVGAGRLLALAQVGGTVSRLLWGFVSDRSFGGRRRPGIVANGLVSAGACALLAVGPGLPGWLAPPLAAVVGFAAFGWVGLYFALIAEIGGARHAGLLTGLGVVFAWSGVLVGPPLFGLVLDITDAYRLPWLGVAVVSTAAAVAVHRLRPLVRRDRGS